MKDGGFDGDSVHGRSVVFDVKVTALSDHVWSIEEIVGLLG